MGSSLLKLLRSSLLLGTTSGPSSYSAEAKFVCLIDVKKRTLEKCIDEIVLKKIYISTRNVD